MLHRLMLHAGCLLTLGSISTFAADPKSEIAIGKSDSAKVYGEWTIRIRPDKVQKYNALIASQGLPLFREAGGRMVGWWTTLVGELYEHITIWEYDGFATFERAIEHLGKEKRFSDFVAARDPLLDGEVSRFLRLAPFAESPVLPLPSRFIDHVIQRVPAAKLADYLKHAEAQLLPTLKDRGFNVVGPLLVDVGEMSELTYLFGYESLEQRERLLGQAKNSELLLAPAYANATKNRLLLPASFAKSASIDKQ